MNKVGRVKGNQMKQEVFLPDDYRPADDEPFMNEQQVEYFRRKLNSWKDERQGGYRDTLASIDIRL